MSTWEIYYQHRKTKDIPWNQTAGWYLNKLWSNYNISHSSNVLDAGCGLGNKSIHLAKKGNKVWGIDISETALNKAIKKSSKLKNPPIFIQGNITEITQLINSPVKFDVVLDLYASQFLNETELEKYLKDIRNLTKNNATYILGHFNELNADSPLWIRDIVKPINKLKKVYGEYFKIIDVIEKKVDTPAKSVLIVGEMK